MASENPVDMLTLEHKYILKVVHALGAIEEDLERGDPVDAELMQGIVRFMREFADECHHAKEEAVLFPAMEDKGVPKTGCPLAALRAEHEKGRKLVTSLKKAADAYAAGNPAAANDMRIAIGGIRHLYPNHIWKEDEMVFPMVQRLFTQDELVNLKAGFDKAEREFGHHHDEFTTFADEMASLPGRERR